MTDREAQLAHCLQIIEEAGDLDRCLTLYPHLDAELRALSEVMTQLSTARPSEVPAASQALSRQKVLTALAEQPARRTFGRGLLARGGAGISVLALLLVGAAGATAATSSDMGLVSNVLSAVGLVDEHESNEIGDSGPGIQQDGVGRGVNVDVGDAIEGSEPGPERGIAVSEAACEAAHDTERLPEQAAAAREEHGPEAKDCEHPNADGTPGAGHGSGKPEGVPAGKPVEPPGKPEEPPGKPSEKPGGGPPASVPTPTAGGSSNPQGGGPPVGGPPGQQNPPSGQNNRR